MGERIPPSPPSGPCPDCLDNMPSPIQMRLKIPYKRITFEGPIGRLWWEDKWIYSAVNWCAGGDFHVNCMAWGGWLLDCIYMCGFGGCGCWPMVGCTDSPGCPGLGEGIFTVGGGGWPPC